ncbi:MAG: hypothetical protein RLZZ387_60 [Chloroflexota bacterium]|jgi:hypothetical protein
MTTLLAVDVGLRAGLALFGQDGRLRWYRSHNFGSATRLRRGASSILSENAGLSWLALEGGGPLADIWATEAARRGAQVLQTGAEAWRERLLLSREQRSGLQAKHNADDLARRIIAWSSAPRPTSLRHDAAEAIALGLWAALQIGWLPEVPPEIRRG